MNLEVLSLFHHIHHTRKGHKVHHCGEKHVKADPNVDYFIKHCSCGRHSINKKVAFGHATNASLKSQKIKITFSKKCPEGGWHIESGKI